MKRFYLTFTLPILLLAVSCSDSDTPGGEPSPSDPREECRFSNVKATPAATSADFSASYLYLGGFLVKENGFVCTPAGGGAPVTVVCERSTEPACTLRDLAPETDYELYCYVVAGGHTFRSETISFTTLEKGEEPEPTPDGKVVFGTLTVSERTATSATAAVTYTCEGEATVTDAGFLLKKAGQSAETRQSCGTAATSLRYTFTGLSENTSYEVAAYVVTPSKTWRSTAAGFTTEAGAVTPPDNNTRHKGWAELPNEVSNGDYLYVDHECAMEKGARARNFTACYSKSKLCPVWVAAPLHDAYAKKNVERKNSYKDDPDLPYEQVGKWDGYTRGHMLGSAERLVSREANSQVMYNTRSSVPNSAKTTISTAAAVNGTPPKTGWTSSGADWPIPAIRWWAAIGPTTDKKVSGTTIPTHYFTVLLKAKKSAGKKWVVNCTRDELQCIALFIEHKSYSKNAVTKPAQFDSKGIFMRVSDLEAKTGHKFFMNVPTLRRTPTTHATGTSDRIPALPLDTRHRVRTVEKAMPGNTTAVETGSGPRITAPNDKTKKPIFDPDMYPWGDARPYHSYAAYCRRTFGRPIQKLPVDGGFTCPNRDGTVGHGGCSFCSNEAFTPAYCDPRRTVRQQVDDAIAFPPARVSGRNGIPGLLPVVQQYLCTARTAPTALRGGARLPRRRGDRRGHPSRLRGCGQAGLSGRPRPPHLRLRRVRHRIDLRRHAAHDRPGPRLRRGTTRRRGDGRTRRRRGRALHPRPARRERRGAARPHAHHQRACRSPRSSSTSCSSSRDAHDRPLRRGARAVPPLDGRRIRRPDGRNPAPPAARHRRRTHRGPDAAPHPLPAAVGNLRGDALWRMLEKRLVEKNAYQGEFFVSSQR